MSRQERYGTRDLTYSAWHRRLEHDLTYIDVDGLEYCIKCREPLALIETARDVGQSFKPTPVLQRLAKCSGLPAYCALYSIAETGELAAFRVQQLWPTYTALMSMSPADYADLLRLFRDRHECRVPA